MVDEINIAKIDFTFENRKKKSIQFQFLKAQLIINDELILPMIQDEKIHNITSCNIVLGANNITVNIVDYTLTDTIYFSAFYNMPSNISIFQSKGTSVHVINQKIDLMQLDCPKILIADCQIRELDIGLAEHHKALMESSKATDNTMQTAYKMKSIDIRQCQISFIRAYVECDNINLQESIIDTFNLHGGFGSKAVAEVKKLNIWQYTKINVTEIYCKISDFVLEDSTISNIAAKTHCKFDKLSIVDSVVLNAHNFDKNHFQQLDYSSWSLISKSAENSRNLTIKAEANYQMAKESYKTEKGFNKLIGKLFGFCTGYGYKPMRALLSCVILIIVGFLILTIKDYIYFGYDVKNNLLNNASISIAAIAGQSGLQRTNGLEFWITSAEYIGGIILFAMFVNALYVRYKD